MTVVAPALETRALSIGYESRTVARAIDLTFKAGTLVSLIGPNGAGKTTLLRTLAGLLAPQSGEILVGGKSIHDFSPSARAKQVGIVLTERPDTGWLTGFDLVATGRHAYTGWDGRLSRDDTAIIDASLLRLGAQPFRDRVVSDLSDGERQRVMVARALAQAPQLLLLDEVTSFLDLPRRVQFFNAMSELARAEGLVVIISTHELELALRYADRLLIFDRDRLLVGAPEDLVLSGDFTRVFQSEGVTFDNENGHFELERPAMRKIEVEGSGRRKVWTRRAIERCGYSGRAELKVEVHDHEWWVVDGANRITIPSIAMLIDFLRAKART